MEPNWNLSIFPLEFKHFYPIGKLYSFWLPRRPPLSSMTNARKDRVKKGRTRKSFASHNVNNGNNRSIRRIFSEYSGCFKWRLKTLFSKFSSVYFKMLRMPLLWLSCRWKLHCRTSTINLRRILSLESEIPRIQSCQNVFPSEIPRVGGLEGSGL